MQTRSYQRGRYAECKSRKDVMKLWDELTANGVKTRFIIPEIKGIDRRKALRLCRLEAKQEVLETTVVVAENEELVRPKAAKLFQSPIVV
jgi:hypothetical protein